MNAIPAGADLGEVASRLMLWLLREPGSPLMFDSDAARRLWRDRLPFDEVADLYDRRLRGEQPEPVEGLVLGGEAARRVEVDIMGKKGEVNYACLAIDRMAKYATMPERVNLPAAALRGAASALGLLEYLSMGRPSPRASRDVTYVSAADQLVKLLMEAPTAEDNREE